MKQDMDEHARMYKAHLMRQPGWFTGQIDHAYVGRRLMRQDSRIPDSTWKTWITLGYGRRLLERYIHAARPPFR